MLNMRNWKAALLLSLIVPIGLLTTFKITGMVREPATVSETMTLEPVKWELERPDNIIAIEDTVKSFYDDESISVNCSVFVYGYHDISEYASDYVSLSVNVTATLQAGFVDNVNITFLEDYEDSAVWVPNAERDTKFYENLRNLSIVDWAQPFSRWWRLHDDVKAFIKADGINQPSNVCFWSPAHWILRSPRNQTHLMEVAVELVYFNGTVYKRLVQPYQLKIGPDNNNSFETAGEITGEAHSLYIGGYDTDDYYKFYVQEGHKISIGVDMMRIVTANVDLLLYDSEQNYKDHVRLDRPPYPSLNFTAYSSGYWYIQIHLRACHTFYSLTVNTYLPEGDQP
jgi:hypothetical protein